MVTYWCKNGCGKKVSCTMHRKLVNGKMKVVGVYRCSKCHAKFTKKQIQ